MPSAPKPDIWTSPTANQKALLAWSVGDDQPQVCLNVGDTGVGKSECAVLALMMRIRQRRKERRKSGQFALIGTSLEAVRANLMPFVEDVAAAFRWTVKPSGRFTRLIDRHGILQGSLRLLGAWDDRAERGIRGGNLYGGIIDEAVLIDQRYLEMAMLRFREREDRVIMTANPGAPTSYIKQDWWDPDRADVLRIAHRLTDRADIDEAEIERRKAMATGARRARMFELSWAAEEGLIYEEASAPVAGAGLARGDRRG